MAEDNRRRYPRYRHRLPVQVTLGKRSEDATTADVSQQGVFVYLGVAPAMRCLVRLRFMLTEGTVDAVAVVVRVLHPNSEAEAVGVGLQFITMDPQHEEKWRHMLGGLKASQMIAPPPDAAGRSGTGTQVPVATPPTNPARVPTAPMLTALGSPPPPSAGRTATGTRMPAVAPPPASPPARTATGTQLPAVGAPVVSAAGPDLGIRAFTAALVFRIRPARIEDVADVFNLDMSSGAIMVEGVPPLESGTVVRVEIVHPATGSVLPLEASVFARLPQGGLAVSLAPLHDAQRRALAAFLAEKAVVATPIRSLPPLPPLRAANAPAGEVP